MRAHERIAAALHELGVDARPIDGWVYVRLASGGVLCISAEHGASLEAQHFPLAPTWFVTAQADREPDPEPYDGPASTYEMLLRDAYRGPRG